MKSKMLIGLVIVVLIIGGAVYLAKKPKAKTATNTSSQSTPATTPAPDTSTAAATINYGNNGFSPASTTVTSGQTVTFTNSSTAAIQVDSDPHPQHTDDTDLNVGTIAAGQSKTITVTKKGSFGIHNHLDPSMKATLVIQ